MSIPKHLKKLVFCFISLFKVLGYRSIALSLLFFFQISASEFRLADYEHIAVTTDLEPDDVLALKILFDETSRLYTGKSYPIKLIVVGEGNSAVKKIRMEILLKSYLNVPNGVEIAVKEGCSTIDNVFPFDGEELGLELKCLPFPQKEEGTGALVEFVKGAAKPLIIQLKPAQEVAALSFHKELAAKTEVLCYGSFNLRKALHDEAVARRFGFTEQGVPIRLQMLLDQFGRSFKKVGIVETFGVLGEEGAVYQCYPWTRPIGEMIEKAQDPFYVMLKILIANWNKYKLDGELKLIAQLVPSCKQQIFRRLCESWSDVCFVEQMCCLKKEPLPQSLERSLNFANKVRPGAGLQFTLSDVILVLALIDSSFTASPVSLSINEMGFLQTRPDSKSNIFYYNKIDHGRFVEILMPKLAWTQVERLPAAA